jgi:hypothetical protein
MAFSYEGASGFDRQGRATRVTESPGSVAIAVAAIVLTAGMIDFRVLEMPASPLLAARVAISLLALGAFAFARRERLASRTTLLVAIECVAALVMFAFVDVPFVEAHRAQISRFTLELSGQLGR